MQLPNVTRRSYGDSYRDFGVVARGVEFTKAHVNGNDFVVIFRGPELLDKAVVRAIADRRYGVGCDQILFVQPGTSTARMETYDVTIFNNDGTSAKMCGNGVCAVALCIASFDGHKNVDIVARVCEAEYGIKVQGPDATVEFLLPTLLSGGVISTGNKHVVREMSEADNIDFVSKHHSECNIHFVSTISDTKIRIKTFERGAGWTSACGSGAVASVFGLGLKGRVEVVHDGGVSIVEVLGNRVYLTVRPQIVFRGVWCEQSIT
jgi:diaminopimelate epimerase